SPKVDTLSGKSAPHTPGPRIGRMRTMPAPSLTVPALRHCTSASWRHGARSAKKPPPLHPANAPRRPRTMEPTRYQRTPHAMAGGCDGGCEHFFQDWRGRAAADPRLARWLKELRACVSDGWFLLTSSAPPDRSHRRPDRRQALTLRVRGVSRNCVARGGERANRDRAIARAAG